MEGLDDFVSAPAAPVEAVVEPQLSNGEEVSNGGAAPLLPDDFISTPEETQAAFIGGFTPAPAAPTPVLAAAAPEEDDPRVSWRRKNADVLKSKDEEEAKAKAGVTAKAAEHLKAFYESRSKLVSTKKDSNRTAGGSSSEGAEAGVPAEGTRWDKVNKLVSFSAGTHHKDVDRFKSTLVALKGKA